MHWSYSILVVGSLIGVVSLLRHKKRLRSLEDGPCAGRDWRSKFPDAAEAEIRQFLDIFGDAFSINRSARINFAPDRKVMDVYRKLYPAGSPVDHLELETFDEDLENSYGVSVEKFWRDDITLGDIFQYIRSHHHAQN
jgi:hypothetical protein